MKSILQGALGCTLALALAACSSGDRDDTAAAPTNAVAADAQESAPASANASDSDSDSDSQVAENRPAQAGASVPPDAAKDVIGLDGLGELKIGEPLPAGSTWAKRGAQAGEACRTVNSPDYPGVYAIVSGGKVERITVGARSKVKLVEGIGVGSSESDVRKWFGGFRAEPHKYIEAPAKYLTAPNAASGGPAVRFEIGKDGKVALIHVGEMPVLGYVEGCS